MSISYAKKNRLIQCFLGIVCLITLFFLCPVSEAQQTQPIDGGGDERQQQEVEEDTTTTTTTTTKILTRKQRNQVEARKFEDLKKRGRLDEVGHTAEAAALRNYQLRKKKRKGILGKKEKSLAEVLFPGVAPELYTDNEPVFMMTDLVQSKKTVRFHIF